MFLFEFYNIVQELKFLSSAILFLLIKTAIDTFRWNSDFFDDEKMNVEICIAR